MQAFTKTTFFFFLFFLSSNFSNGQTETTKDEVRSNKSRFYVYWGWNRGFYSKSDIHFKGDDYNFTLQDVIATDRQSDFSIETYFKPSSLTIPQTNFGIGYYLRDNYILTVAIDHMKYVVQTRQEVQINGTIGETYPLFAKNYQDEPIVIIPAFLKMEHTDGLNYFAVGISRADNLFKKIAAFDNKLELQVVEGIEAGLLIPRSDVHLLGQDDINVYHLAGWGSSLKAGLHLTFFKHYFIHGEAKGGYINLSDVLTSSVGNNKAKQDFFFLQTTFQIGGIFYFK